MDHNVARQFAGIILFIGMIASGIAASFALAGNITGSLYVCGGALVVAVLVLLLGGLAVGSNKPPEEE